MIWKYIGESSVSKTKVRILTTVISLIFLAVCYGLLVFPLLKIKDAEKVSTGLLWNVVLGTILFIMSLSYRMIMEKLSLSRRPNTYLSRSKFVVLTTVFFHILFYLYIPAIYFVETHQAFSRSEKLKTLFFQVFLFLLFSLIIATVDVRYRLFMSRRKKYLSQASESQKVCQKKLHDILTFPSFPI